MESGAPPGPHALEPAPAADLGPARELQSLLAVRLAHRGWPVRVEVLDGTSGPHVECRPYALDDHNSPLGPTLSIPVTEEPIDRQVIGILHRIEQAGWVMPTGSSSGWTNPRAGAGIWCVPE